MTTMINRRRQVYDELYGSIEGPRIYNEHRLAGQFAPQPSLYEMYRRSGHLLLESIGEPPWSPPSGRLWCSFFHSRYYGEEQRPRPGCLLPVEEAPPAPGPIVFVCNWCGRRWT